MPKTEEKRITASSVVTRLLLLKNIPADDTIIATVRKETGSKKFNKLSLSFYKTQARNGELVGQTKAIDLPRSNAAQPKVPAKSVRHAKKAKAKATEVVEE